MLLLRLLQTPPFIKVERVDQIAILFGIVDDRPILAVDDFLALLNPRIAIAVLFKEQSDIREDRIKGIEGIVRAIRRRITGQTKQLFDQAGNSDDDFGAGIFDPGGLGGVIGDHQNHRRIDQGLIEKQLEGVIVAFADPSEILRDFLIVILKRDGQKKSFARHEKGSFVAILRRRVKRFRTFGKREIGEGDLLILKGGG